MCRVWRTPRDFGTDMLERFPSPAVHPSSSIPSPLHTPAADAAPRRTSWLLAGQIIVGAFHDFGATKGLSYLPALLVKVLFVVSRPTSDVNVCCRPTVKRRSTTSTQPQRAFQIQSTGMDGRGELQTVGEGGWVVVGDRRRDSFRPSAASCRPVLMFCWQPLVFLVRAFLLFALCRRLSAVVVVAVVVRKVYIAPLLILTLAVKILLCETFVCGEWGNIQDIKQETNGMNVFVLEWWRQKT